MLSFGSITLSCVLYSSSSKARFIRRISVASNAIQTIDNEIAYLIIYCLIAFDVTEIRRMKRA